MARQVSRRERQLLVAAAVMAVLTLLARPLSGRLAALGSLSRIGPRADRMLEEKTKVIAAYRQAVGREETLAAEAAEVAAKIAAAEKALLPGATPPLAAADLQTKIKELADQAGLKIQSEKILPHLKRDPYLEIPVQIVANGDIRAVKDFLIAVDSSELFMGVQELGLKTVRRRTAGPDAREFTDIQASMTFAGLIRSGRP